MHKHLKFCSVSLLLAVGACAGSQAEQVRDARNEQAEARSQVSEDNIDQAAKTRQESVDTAHDVRQERIADANQPGENATEDLNEISRDRVKYQTDAQTRVSKLGVRIDEAAKKVNVLGNRAPTKLRDELKAATTEYNMLKQDVDKLNRTETTDWESKTSQIDGRISALNSRVEDLKEKIDDVDV
jgi:chromosome segregation ATPase